MGKKKKNDEVIKDQGDKIKTFKDAYESSTNILSNMEADLEKKMEAYIAIEKWFEKTQG